MQVVGFPHPCSRHQSRSLFKPMIAMITSSMFKTPLSIAMMRLKRGLWKRKILGSMLQALPLRWKFACNMFHGLLADSLCLAHALARILGKVTVRWVLDTPGWARGWRVRLRVPGL